jgi:hypothetical protein
VPSAIASIPSGLAIIDKQPIYTPVSIVMRSRHVIAAAGAA